MLVYVSAVGETWLWVLRRGRIALYNIPVGANALAHEVGALLGQRKDPRRNGARRHEIGRFGCTRPLPTEGKEALQDDLEPAPSFGCAADESRGCDRHSHKRMLQTAKAAPVTLSGRPESPAKRARGSPAYRYGECRTPRAHRSARSSPRAARRRSPLRRSPSRPAGWS